MVLGIEQGGGMRGRDSNLVEQLKLSQSRKLWKK
jgi:hypothetical protein